jgi:hypothetical protein
MHEAWCAKWRITYAESARAVNDFLAGRQVATFRSGRFDAHWTDEAGCPPVPRVGQYYAATVCDDGAWFILQQCDGEVGLSDTTPGFPPTVVLYLCEPASR